MLPVGDSRMEWTLRLVGTGIDGQSRSFEVMAISRSDGLGEIANLGLTLAEGNLLLAQVQQQVVAEQANTHAADFGLVPCDLRGTEGHTTPVTRKVQCWSVP